MKRGKFWIYCLLFSLLFLAPSLLSAESETEFTVPSLEPAEEYVMMGQDIMDLYQTVIDLKETKTEYKNLTNEMMGILNDAQALCHEYEKENKKLTLQNNFLIGGITISVGVVVVGAVLFTFTNIK